MTPEIDAAASPCDLSDEARRLALFHAGDRSLFEEMYDVHYETVDRAVGRVLSGADRETVVHEIFYRLLASESMRRRFQGGSFAAWIATVARNHAFDFVRRYRHEVVLASPETAQECPEAVQPFERADATLLIAHFRTEILPAKWAGVFQLRFLDGLSQREAARALGLQRTTLVYQELRIQRLLSRFLLGSERP
jgi:RNA polymerase sigma-70 factor (ECF subfamily)